MIYTHSLLPVKRANFSNIKYTRAQKFPISLLVHISGLKIFSSAHASGFTLFSQANLFINYYHKHPDSHAAAGRDCAYKKDSWCASGWERNARLSNAAALHNLRECKCELFGVLLEFHIQGVSGWLNDSMWVSTARECIFSRRVTRSWLDAENMMPMRIWRMNLSLRVRSAWRESYIRVTFMVCLAQRG